MALGPLTAPKVPAVEQSARLLRIAELEKAVGDEVAAERAMERAFLAALAYDRFALAFEPASQTAARAALARVTAACTSMAREIEHSGLLVSCARGPVAIDRKVLAWARAERSYASDPEQRWWHTLLGDEGAPAGSDAHTPAKELAQRGREGFELLHGRLAGSLREPPSLLFVKEAAEALLAYDPLHVEARIWLQIERDVAQGRLKVSDGLLGHLTQPRSDADWVRVELEARQQPKSIGLRLWLLLRAVRGDLVGDASLGCQELANNPQLNADQRAIAATIDALARAQWGEIDALKTLLAAAESRDSPFVWNELAKLADHEALTEQARAAKRHIYEHDLARYQWWSSDELAADPLLSPALRERAIAESSRSNRPVLRHCLERKLSLDACNDKLEAAAYLDEYEAGWDQILALDPDEIVPDWLTQVGPESEDPEAVDAFMARAKGTPLGRTGPYLRLALAIAINKGDQALEASLTEQVEPYLSTYEHIGLALTQRNRKQGHSVGLDEALWYADLFSPVDEPEPADAEPPSWLLPDQDEAQPSTLTGSFVRAVQLRGAGFVHQSLAEILPLLQELDGEPGAWLAYYALDSARIARDPRAEEQALRRLQELDPKSVWAQLASPPSGKAGCQLGLGMVTQPRSRLLCAQALPSADRNLVDAFRELEAAIDPDSLAAALRRAGVTMSQAEWVTFLQAPYAERLFALDDARLTRAATDETLVDGLLEGLDELPPEEALARARRVAPMLPKQLGGLQAAWLAWFAGLGEESERRAAELKARDRFVPSALLGGTALRKALPTALAYRVLSVLGMGKASERATLARELSRISSTLATEDLRCELLEESDAQAAVCRRAWELGSRSTRVASEYAELLDDAKLPERDSVATRFVTEAKARFGRKLPAAVWQVEALLEARAGHVEKAARATEEMWAAGGGIAQEGSDLAQARHRPLVARLATLRGHWGAARHDALAFTCLHDGQLAAADLYLKAARAVGRAPQDREGLARALDTQDLLELARRDVSARQLDHASVAEGMVARRDEAALAAVQKLKKRHPKSMLLTLFEAELLLGSGELVRALEQTRRVAERHADLGLVAAQLSRFLTLRGRYGEARSVLADARQHLPEDPRLADLTIPEGADVPTSGVLAVFTSAEGVLKAVRAVSQAELDALNPQLSSHAETSAELAMPAGYEPAPRFDLGGQRAGLTVGVKVMARASRCEPALCIAPINQQYEQMDLTLLWSEVAELPQGPVAISLTRGPENLLLTVALPIGERVYVVFVAGPETQLAQRAPEIALALHSFRPLDAVLGIGQAQVLREAPKTTGRPVEDRARIRARLDALKAGPGCPLQSTLASVASEQSKSWLLLDTYLSTPTEAGRKALVRCASTPAQRAELGLVTLWDENPSLHDQGLAFIRADPRPAMAQLQRILPVLDQRALSAASEKTEELAPHGVGELLAAVRGQARLTLALELLTHGSERVRRVTLAALSLDVDLPLPDAMLKLADTSPLSDLPLWLDAGGHDPRMLSLARKRLDGIASLNPQTFREVAHLADYLAAKLDPADGARLSEVSRRAHAMEEEYGAGAGTLWLQDLVRQYEVALGAAPTRQDSNPLLLEARASLLRAQRPGTGSPARTKAVLSGSLADALPGPAWSYFRVQDPARLLSEVKRLYARLGAPGNTQRPVALAMLNAMLEGAGSGLLADAQGLDLKRPIECAAPEFRPEVFVCSGYVRDRDALRKELGRRESGQDDGVALLTHVVKAVASMADSVELTPGLVHDMQYGSQGGRAEQPGVTVERMRSEVRIGDDSLELMTILDTKESGDVTRDIELSLFGKDRWIVFAGRELAHWVLAEQTTPALSAQAEFRRTMQELGPQGGIQAYLRSGDDRAPVALELGTTEQGVDARIVTTRDGEAPDLARLSQTLPEGAVSSYATDEPARVIQPLRNLRPHREAGSIPPLWLFSDTPALAFGWYPAPGEALWAHWVAVAQLSPSGKAEGFPSTFLNLKAGERAEWQGLHAARLDDRWVVTTGAGLLRSALEQAARSGRTQGKAMHKHGKVDVARIARFIGQLAGGAGQGAFDQRAMGLRSIAALASIAGELSYRTTRKGALETLELQLRPELAGRGEAAPSTQRPGSLADRNAIKVETPVPDNWLENGIVVRLRAKGSDGALLRAFLPSARLQAKALPDGAVELQVSPGPAPDEKPAASVQNPLQLLRLLSQDDMIRPNDAPIRDLARKLAGSHREVKQRVSSVLQWVSTNLTYELQPSSANATRILEQRRGDCTEFAVLTVSLLRSLGIASEVRSGLVLSEGELVAHAWAAYYDGAGFREIDPTAGSMSVHAGYIEASVLDITALLSLADIEVVDVAAKP